MQEHTYRERERDDLCIFNHYRVEFNQTHRYYSITTELRSIRLCTDVNHTHRVHRYYDLSITPTELSLSITVTEMVYKRFTVYGV